MKSPKLGRRSDDYDGVIEQYKAFARFYDEIMVDAGRDHAERIIAAISNYLPTAESLLELGCGTGAVLAHLRKLPILTGLDNSAAMLAIAADKVPAARLLQMDMRAFELPGRFDVIASVHDTLNHVPTFEDWKAVFRRVGSHLVGGGLFIFDVNTIGRLQRLAEGPPWVHDFGGGTLIMNIGSSPGDPSSVWDIRIFEPHQDGHFMLHREQIPELGVKLSLIKAELNTDFELLEETDPEGGPPTDNASRAYFVYRRRSQSVTPSRDDSALFG